jgi:hypothetical protein
MKWSKHVDNIVTVVSLLLMTSGAILYFYGNAYRLFSEIIFLIGLALLVLEATAGGGGGEEKQSNCHPWHE